MPNLSWLYFKGYYNGFSLWDKIDSKEKEDKKRIEDFFTRKNEPIFKYAFQKLAATPQQVLLQTQYPGLLIGSGYTHETGAVGECKIGFHLDYTTGLPIIPGTSIKGALRAVFPQFKPDEKKPWLIKEINKEADINKAKAKYIGGLLSFNVEAPDFFAVIHELEMHLFEGLNIAESKDRGKAVYYSIYKRDLFHDAAPVKGGKDNKLFGPDSITPHTKGALKNPVPLLFMKVLPMVTYAFNFSISAPEIMGVGVEKRKKLFTAILTTFGIGAKTNVGYGQFK
jgi:CRISPR-associated protein Cmr6